MAPLYMLALGFVIIKDTVTIESTIVYLKP